jgi:hypothetical protein
MQPFNTMTVKPVKSPWIDEELKKMLWLRGMRQKEW